MKEFFTPSKRPQGSPPDLVQPFDISHTFEVYPRFTKPPRMPSCSCRSACAATPARSATATLAGGWQACLVSLSTAEGVVLVRAREMVRWYLALAQSRGVVSSRIVAKSVHLCADEYLYQ